MFQKILIAYDGSRLSRRAIEAAKHQSKKQSNVKVHIVYVMKESGPHTNVNISRSIQKELIEKYRPQLQMIEKEFERKNIPAITEILFARENENFGKPICKYAEDHEMDLIIMGSRGLGNIRRIFLGSVSNNVVQHAKCPVLIIK